jgi:conjugative transposon TraN protein
MKKISAVIVTGILLILMKVQVFSQNTLSTEKASVIEPYHLEITLHKTTNLVFPYAIKSVDKGSKDVLVQKANGVDNILQVKAGKKSFEETNLTVITADDKLYSYILNYTNNPTVLNIRFASIVEEQTNVFSSSAHVNEAKIQEDVKNVVEANKNIKVKDKKFGIKTQLDGLYINNGVMYYRLNLQNRSNINYNIEQLRFFIRDQKRSKRTAIQELEVVPLYIHGNTSVIKGHSEHVFVFAVSKFTIPDKKYLAIQLMEKNGGRNLQLKISNRKIVQAKPLSHPQ